MNDKPIFNLRTLYYLLTQKEERFRVSESVIYSQTSVLIPDVSKWEGDIDFVTMKARGVAGVFIKAGQGSAPDPKFATYWIAARNVLPRGTYWFYDSRVSPERQAQLWADLIEEDPGELMHMADFEENYGGPYGGWQNFKIFLQEFQRLSGLLDNRIGIYTGYYYWIGKVPIREMDWFGRYTLWLASYNAPENVLIPRPWNNDTTILWQYTDHADGLYFGVSSRELDLSHYVNGGMEEYRNRFGLLLESNPTPTAFPYDGVEYYKFQKNGVNVHVKLIDTKKVRARVIYDPWLQTVSQFAKDNGAQMAVNGNAWDFHQLVGPWIPLGLAANNGTVISNDRSGVPFLNIAMDGSLSMPFNDYSNLYNAVSGFRYLIRDGNPLIPENGTEEKYTELHARSGKGITKDGRLITVITDGTTDMRTGLTLYMLMQVFQMFNTVIAMDNDSGGSSEDYTEALGGVLNTPADGHERAVSTALIFYTGESRMFPYDVVSTQYDMSLRVGHDVLSEKEVTVFKNTVMHADSIWTAPADGTYVKAGDKWAHVVDIAGVAKDGWVAIIHMGVTYCTVTDNAVVPSPTLPTLTVSLRGAGYPDLDVTWKPL